VNASVEGAQVSNDRGREAASITYRVEMPGHGPRRVRVSVFPYDHRDFTVAQPLPRAKVFRTGGGRNVVIWREDAVVYRLEGEEDLDEADLLRMLPKVLPAEDESNLATPLRRPTVPYQPAGLRQ